MEEMIEIKEEIIEECFSDCKFEDPCENETDVTFTPYHVKCEKIDINYNSFETERCSIVEEERKPCIQIKTESCIPGIQTEVDNTNNINTNDNIKFERIYINDEPFENISDSNIAQKVAERRKKKAEYQKAYRERKKKEKNVEKSAEQIADSKKRQAKYQKAYEERKKVQNNELSDEQRAQQEQDKKRKQAEYQKAYRRRKKIKINESSDLLLEERRKNNLRQKKVYYLLKSKRLGTNNTNVNMQQLQDALSELSNGDNIDDDDESDGTEFVGSENDRKKQRNKESSDLLEKRRKHNLCQKKIIIP